MPDEPTRALVERKLALLVGYADELSALLAVRKPPSRTGNVERRAIERLVQLLVEVAADINGIVIVASGSKPPASARESFVALRGLGIVPEELADRFVASYVGLRNRIVHDYDTLDHRLVLAAARRILGDSRAYGRRVRQYLGPRPD